MASGNSPSHRRGLVKSVLGIDVRLVFEQDLDDFHVALVRRKGQGRRPICGLRIHINAFGQKRLNDLGVAVPGGRHEILLGVFGKEGQRMATQNHAPCRSESEHVFTFVRVKSGVRG